MTMTETELRTFVYQADDGTRFFSSAAVEGYASQLFSSDEEFIGETFKARRLSNGSWEVKDFPIFAETKRWNEKSGKIDDFNAQWIDAAAEKANLRQSRDKYLPPVHVKHTGSRFGAQPKCAGKMKDFRTGSYKVEGEDKHTLFVTLTEIPDDVFREMERGTLGYRSVEILKPDKPEVSSLALLDDEVPYFKFAVARFTPESSGVKARFAEAEKGKRIAVVFPWPTQFRQDEDAMSKYEADDDCSKDEKGDDDDYEKKDEEYEKEMKGKKEEKSDDEEQKMNAGFGYQPDSGGSSGSNALQNLDPMMLQQLAALLAPYLNQSQQAQQLPTPVPPVSASENTSQGVKFMDPNVAQKFAQQNEEIAALREQLASERRRHLIEAGIQRMADWSGDQVKFADGRVGIERVHPDSISFYAEQAQHLPEDQILAWFDKAAPAARKFYEEASAQDIDESTDGDDGYRGEVVKFAESLSEDKTFARFFGEDRDPKDTITPDEYADAALKFADAYDALPSERKAEWDGKGGRKEFVRTKLIMLGYAA